MPTVRIVFSGKTPKENENPTDCQDYLDANEANTCFAIADGASQSFYPSMWAEFLVEKFCQDPEIEQKGWEEWVKSIQDEWSSEVEERVKKAKSENKPTWVTNQNRLSSRVPATSTFIGLQFLENQNQVKVSIVGDSCLFVLRGHELKETHPLKKSSDFNDRPEYFASYANHNEYSPKFFDIPLNDEKSSERLYFILATDALSEYIFKCEEEHKEAIFKDLLSISSPKNFENFVSERRNSSSIKMKNDEVALIILDVSDISIIKAPSQLTDTTKGDFKIPISKQSEEEVTRDDIKDLEKEKIAKNNIKKLQIENRRLKHHRSALGALATVFLLSIFVVGRQISNFGQSGKDESPETNTAPIKTIKLPQKTVVYADQDLTKKILMNPLSNSFEVVIRDENEKWTRFETTLYAHKSILSNCDGSCDDNEIEVKPSKNIKVFPTNESKLDDATFGQLTDIKKFDKLEFHYIKDWYKFKIVGYIKNEVPAKR